MEIEGYPFAEAISKLLPKPKSLQEVKAWRERELAAGRRSSYEDYCRLHGLCTTCDAGGLVKKPNGLGLLVVGVCQGEQLFQRCPDCGGTGYAHASQEA